MAATTNQAVADRTTEIGRGHVAGCLDEFGEVPTREAGGDWDVAAWQGVTRALNAEFDTEARGDEGLYVQPLDAYRSGLFRDS